MIFSILFLLLFFVSVALIILFVFLVLIPSVNQQEGSVSMYEYLLAPDEKKKQKIQRNRLKDTGLRAVVKCSCEKQFAKQRLEYSGLKDCRLFNQLYQSEYDCLFQCIGFGTCVNSCPQQAIKIHNNTAVILKGCIGCGRCAEICPKNIIDMVPVETASSAIRCNAENGDTTCSDYKKIGKNEIPKRNIFKFWRLCYSIFYKENR